MKLIGLAGILALSSLACQRKEETTAAKPPAPASTEPASSPASSAEEKKEAPASKPTKASERSAVTEKKIPVAEPVADKPGFVKSPFNGGIIDVRGMPPGVLVADPTYPAVEKKFFRLPETPQGSESDDSAGPLVWEDPETGIHLPALNGLAEPDLPTDEQIASAPVAQGVPGKPGFIFSPYDNKIVDANGIEPGTVFKDPGSPPDAPRFIKLPGGDAPADGE